MSGRFVAHRPLGATDRQWVVLDATTGRPVENGTHHHRDLAEKIAALLSLPLGAPVLVHEPVNLVYKARIVGWRWDVMWPVVEWTETRRWGVIGPLAGMRGLPGAWQTVPAGVAS